MPLNTAAKPSFSMSARRRCAEQSRSLTWVRWFENVRIIEGTGHELIAVRRRGLTADQKRALALADNRAAELATWNLDHLRADADAGLDLAAFFATNVRDEPRRSRTPRRRRLHRVVGPLRSPGFSKFVVTSPPTRQRGS